MPDIDAIITDPPYPFEFINCFSELSLFVKEHLKKDGFVAVYSGQYHLPKVIKRLSEHLTYVWTFCLYHIGEKQLVINEINIVVMIVGLVIIVSNYFLNPARQNSIDIALVKAQIESYQKVSDQIQILRNNDIVELKEGIKRLEDRQIEIMKQIVKLETLINK